VTEGFRLQTTVVSADAPVLLFGGPYSNLEATHALLAEAARRGIPPRRIVCTGDVVAYGADAAATVELIRDAGIQVVMGNCEESLADRRDDCGCGFAEGSTCDALSAAWYRHATAAIGDAHRAWMADLPRRIDLAIGGRRLAVVHGGVDSINRFVFASTPEADKRAEIATAGGDGIIGGHCGLPFTQILDDRLWHNPGAIGLPANDGTPRVWFGIITPRADGLTIEHHPFAYDHATAARKMRTAGLPEGYAAALATGLWPSLDVLPAAERAAQGRPIEASAVAWPNQRALNALRNLT
jgi:Predicted phosphoesterase